MTDVTLANGRRIVGPSYQEEPAGCSYLAVLDPDGTELTRITADQWAASPAAVISALADIATAGHIGTDRGYGTEFAIGLADHPTIQIRFSDTGDYVRLTDVTADFDEWVEDFGELVYWHCDEWAEDPLLVAGAFLGLANTGGGRTPR